MDLKKQTIDTYDRTAPDMAEKFAKRTNQRYQDIARAFAWCEKENPAVLELGSGTGRDAAGILRHTNNYLGIDLSEGMVEVARKAVPEARFACADIETFAFPKSLDIIFAFASLLHLDKAVVKRVLERAYLSLYQGGFIYISLKKAPYEALTRTDEFGARTYYFYEPHDLEGMVPGFRTRWSDVQELPDQTWFTLVLQK